MATNVSMPGLHTAPDVGNGVGFTRSVVLQHRSLQKWVQTYPLQPPLIHIYRLSRGQRGPSSMGNPSLPFTISRTVVFHRGGRHIGTASLTQPHKFKLESGLVASSLRSVLSLLCSLGTQQSRFTSSLAATVYSRHTRHHSFS